MIIISAPSKTLKLGRFVLPRALVGDEPSPSAADAQAAAELLETPGAADLLLSRAMLDEETMKQRQINSQIYKQLFGNG